MSRERWLIAYCLVLGSLNLLWLALSGPGQAPLWALLLFLVLAMLIESARFRVTPSDAHSLIGIVLLTASFTLGPENGALIAAVSGFLSGLAQSLIYGGPRTLYTVLGRPLLRSGVRAGAILTGGALAVAATGNPPEYATFVLLSTICYPLIVQFNRVAREYLQGGRTGVVTWWRAAWLPILSAEIGTLPTAWLAAGIYRTLGVGYFLLAAVILYATALTVRRASLNLQRQRRSVRELALLNQVSRAIIRSGLDVDALCELIYGEASKLVDTSSFHIGLFTPGSDQYTLVVRVQDRVRLPPLTSSVPAGDGIIGWMRETGRSLLVHDFQEEMDALPARPRYQSNRPPRSGIYVPLIADDAVIGSISIQSYRPSAFDADDMRLLSLIADQAAVAIAKARAFDEARERAVQLQAIHEVSERITAILDIDELLPSVVHLIRERFGYHPVHIFTLDPGGRLAFRASTVSNRGVYPSDVPDLRVGVGLVGAAIEEGRPVVVNDVSADTRYVADSPGTRSEMALPLRFGESYIGVLDLQTAEPDGFHDSDMFVMQTLAGQIAVAIESAGAFTAQRQEAWTLNALLQVAENIAHASSLEELLPTVVRMPPLLLGCDRCYCLLYEAEGDSGFFQPLAAYGLPPAERAALFETRIEAGDAPVLVGALHTSAPTIVSDPQERLAAGPLARFGGGTMVVMGLTARGAPLGVLLAEYDEAPQLPQHALTLYSGIAGQVAGALESALLAQDAAKGERLEQELRVARDIQTALLPARTPAVPGWDIAADWRSARLVGGDFYDFWRLARRIPAGGAALPTGEDAAANLGFVIADVSDKGVPAAMFMALSRSLVRAAALDGSPPELALARANRWITRDSESAMFVTLFYGMLDLDTGALRYSCAGHNPPLLVRAADGAVTELSTHGVALGVLEDAPIGEAQVTMEPGDVLVCYTDGITEAIDAREEGFGVPRLVDVVVAQRGASAEAIVQSIARELVAFTGGLPPFDDITMVVIKRDP